MSSEPIEFTYREDPALLAAAMTSWSRAEATERSPLKSALLWLAISLVFGAALGFGAAFLDIQNAGAVLMALGIGFLAGLVVWMVTHRMQVRKLIAMGIDTANDRGEISMRFDDEGVHVRSGLGTSLTKWAAYAAVFAIPGGTVLRAGSTVLPFPDSALPEDLTPDMFRDRLNTWMDAA